MTMQMKMGADGRTAVCWPAAEVQLSLQYLDKHKLLFSGARDGVVQGTYKEKYLSVHTHTQIIIIIIIIIFIIVVIFFVIIIWIVSCNFSKK